MTRTFTNLCIIALALMLNNELFAQQKASRWSVSGYFGPGYTYRFTETEQAGSQLIVDTRDALEVGKFGYTSGLGLHFWLSKNFMLESGVSFANLGWSTKSTKIGNLPEDPSTFEKYNFYNLSAPLNLRFEVIKGKWGYYAMVGAMADFLVQNDRVLITENADGTRNRENEGEIPFLNDLVRKPNFSGQVGIGVERFLSEKLTVFLQPTARMSFGSLKDSRETVKDRLWILSCNVGLRLELGSGKNKVLSNRYY